MTNQIKNVSVVGNKCTACSACMFSCPADAISFQKSDMGARIAAVDEYKCINCGKCIKDCPQYNEAEISFPSEVYAAWSKEDKYNEVSSSGAMAPVFYETILLSGGTVFGAAWQDGEVIIKSTTRLNDVREFCGSKYVESDMSDALSSIKEALDTNREVVFIGLPCQVSAVKRLFKNDKLYTIDLVCHGAPPREYFNKYLEELRIENARDVSFRGKEDFVLKVYNEDGETIYSKGQHVDPYFKAFLDATIYKNCCYSCKYATTQRIGDITIGDFWGINTDTLVNTPKGKISLVFVNTTRGSSLFERSKAGIVYEVRSLEEALKYNRQLSSPSPRGKEREKFEKNYKKYGFIRALNMMKSTKQIKNRNTFFAKVKNKVKIIFGGIK